MSQVLRGYYETTIVVVPLVGAPRFGDYTGVPSINLLISLADSISALPHHHSEDRWVEQDLSPCPRCQAIVVGRDPMSLNT